MPGKLGVFAKPYRDASLLRTFAVRALIASLAVVVMPALAACGKKGPLYLPDSAASAPPAGAAQTDREKQDRR